jgi:hypothetical protein
VRNRLDKHAEQLGALGRLTRLAILRHAGQSGSEGMAAGAAPRVFDLPVC